MPRVTITLRHDTLTAEEQHLFDELTARLARLSGVSGPVATMIDGATHVPVTIEITGKSVADRLRHLRDQLSTQRLETAHPETIHDLD